MLRFARLLRTLDIFRSKILTENSCLCSPLARTFAGTMQVSSTSYATEKFCAVLQVPALVAIMASCVYNFVRSPDVMCRLVPCKNVEARTMVAMFPRAVATACLLSEMVAAYKSYTGAASRYERNLERYGRGGTAGERFRRLQLASAVGAVYALVVLPVNAYRLYLFDQLRYDDATVLFFVLMYAQNWSLCVTEFQFVRRCYALYREFRSINKRMSALKTRTIVANRYPLALKPDETAEGPGTSLQFSSTTDRCVAQLKSRHRAVSDAAADLNGLYGFRLTVSLSVLFVMSLFDIYEFVTSIKSPTKTNFLIHAWLFQYLYRFSMVVLTTHFTTTQVTRAFVQLKRFCSKLFIRCRAKKKKTPVLTYETNTFGLTFFLYMLCSMYEIFEFLKINNQHRTVRNR